MSLNDRERDERIAAAISHTVNGFISGIASDEFISLDFGVHEGRTRSDWILHELREFELRRQAFGLDSGAEVVIDRLFADGGVMFTVKNAAGTPVYQDMWQIDELGQVTGNEAAFEIVSKLHFDSSGPTRRAMAIRSPRGRITSVVPIGIDIEDFRVSDGIAADRDGFTTVSMLIQQDDLMSFEARFRIADNSGIRSTETVRMRGLDDFTPSDDLFAVIDGKKVTIKGEDTVWELNVVLEDGTRSCVEHAAAGPHVFNQRVVTAVVTDPMDNDWLSEA